MSAPPLPDSQDRYARLEHRIAELERDLSSTDRRRVSRRRTPRRLAVIGLVMALAVPAGVVLAGHQFGDVPASNPFHADIAAVAEAGVTTGCGGGNYCPKEFVTREQMAAFMNRLGALAQGKTPVVNARRLEGYHANDLSRVARMGLSGGGPVGTSLAPYGDGFTIDVPTQGFVLVAGNISFSASSCTGACWVRVHLEHTNIGAFSGAAYTTVNDFTPRASASTFALFEVEPGVNTFRFQTSRADGTGTISPTDASAVAIFTPFDATGQTTTPPPSG